jgi:diaminopropionate ammonia-lyase
MGTKRIFRNPLRDQSQVTEAPTASLTYHQSWADYAPTPLREAPQTAQALGVASVWVKDESRRLGMPSFKILGASWATHLSVCRHYGLEPSDIPDLDALVTKIAGSEPVELVAATDGNHGRAVARMASKLGFTCHILVPSDMVAARIEALKSEGARVTVVDGGYDEAVAASAALADQTHLVISDTSWPGYMEVPAWVIDGYGTLTQEIRAQLAEQGVGEPTIVGAQIGVGAFAAAMVRGFVRNSRVIGVEPTRADCVVAAAEAGEIVTIAEPQDSIMAGLNCGTGSPIAWPDVRSGIDTFVTVEDTDAEAAMRLLAQDGIVSGESGAAGLAGLLAFRDELGLTSDDVVLVVSTEGATDPVGYARIVESAPRSN